MNKSVELQMVFEIDISAFRYIRSIENYRQNTTTKLAVHSSVI